MRRRFLKVAAFLMIGAIANVIICAAIALLTDPRDSRPVRMLKPSPELVPDYVRDRWPICVEAELCGIAMGTDEMCVILVATPQDAVYGSRAQPRVFISRIRYGWPWRALFFDECGAAGTGGEVQVLIRDLSGRAGWLRRGIGLGGIQRVLPVAVLLPGFAANAAILAFIGWMSLFGSRVVRRWRWRRRGLCVQCRYPIGSSGQCPECGVPLTPRNSVVS